MDFSAQLLRFNRSVALERVGGDEDLFREIGLLFLEECPVLLAELDTAIQSGDAAQLHRAAHTLKGSLAAVGAEIAAQSALRLEAIGRTGNLTEASAAHEALRRELAAFHPELVAVLES